ncbi:Uncharacterised protein [Chryseobacterium nakagawai]|uniref:Uncharacterized protein n=1 Tax=Chryseobacterium nakagawai TaxID=1241982 RepID=A0AAD1DR93_CHRNA|nr:hypothetical protein [Chryseobacterium nakagawai]AZA91566.1 hypothetical protein EG343_13500 [Chryseobacterium nakagawai]VEH18045.1 Uncharacterised protein [Chryseobacterium nakagawai]
MSKKKLLIHEVFNKAREDFPGESTKSGWASELSDYFEKNMNFMINEKTFTRYYDACIRDDKDINIKDMLILSKLSEYVGYKDFIDFSRTFVKKDEESNKTTIKIKVDEDEESLSEKLSNIIINITNEQHFKMPQFVKQNGLGIAGVFLVISVLIGNNYTSKSKNNNAPLSFFGTSADEKSCMFWEGSEYKLIDCEDKNPQRSLIPKDTVQLKYFKRITRKDTLTVDNALGSTWYSKFNGNVEFFTMDGIDPATGRELRASTAYIIGKYAGY